ncbi:FAD-binding protein [Kordia algicida OT-1]|uniref:FAD linked oxidase domain protein n=1 Tax=Kordia algicida OT-1 TaxID=391587 RepID=A9E0H6_9FLAO|nr:FAD-binding protein [Kordia algicida]EDP95857.1 FAD linked oxidase domain protein [Kordia algicida OT-1]
MSYTFDFSGNSHLTDQELSNTNFQSSDFTVQCWIQTAQAGEILSKKSKDHSFALHINTQGNVVFSVEEAGNTRNITATNLSVLDANWYCITAIKTETFLYIYINNFLLQTENTSEKYDENVFNKFTIGGNKQNHFKGKISQVSVWNRALLESEITKTYDEGDVASIAGLIKICELIDVSKDFTTNSNAELTVKLTIKNTSFETLQLVATTNEIIPKQIEVDEEVKICLESDLLPIINESFRYKNKSGSTLITIKKNLDRFNTSIVALSDKDLVDDLAIKENSTHTSIAELNIGENSVVVNTRNLYNFLNNLRGYLKCDQIQTSGGNLIDEIEYNKASQIFNRRFQLKPFAIIYCESTEDVQRVYKDAIANNLPIRVRSGGHDHEGECSGTDVVLLDMTRINHIEVSHNKQFARIGPGNRFKDLTPVLAENGVMIAHGTCATVGVAGFTLGGGWGPWTRKQGMNCEALVGATVVLGNGEITKIRMGDSDEKDLLWALKGGGGMSYGIVTELELKVFELPKELIKFEVEWNKYCDDDPTIFHENTKTKDIIQAWEHIIINKDDAYSGSDFQNIQLIGTNLKVSGKHLANPATFNPEKEKHNCIMYGYWEGNSDSLKAFVQTCFVSAMPDELRLIGKGGQGANYADDGLMSAWDRESFSAIRETIKFSQDMVASNSKSTAVKTTRETYDEVYKISKPLLKSGENDLDTASQIFHPVSNKKPLPPDLDAPAPHKITSRMANKNGLGDVGVNQLISSLTSELILPDNRKLGLFNYITLGAIVGNFYDTMPASDKEKSAFPYKDKTYTIQYQTWWNTELIQKEQEQNNAVYDSTNRALDWMQVCRDYEIENTSGAFISFKDASIPTATYFADNYEALIAVKKKYAEDPLNHFRTRKTII